MMADDKRFMVGWGSVIAIIASCGLAYTQDWITGLAALGFFLAFSGLILAALSAWGPSEPMLAGGGIGALVLGAAISIKAYDLLTSAVVFFLVVLAAGIALIAIGLKGR